MRRAAGASLARAPGPGGRRGTLCGRWQQMKGRTGRERPGCRPWEEGPAADGRPYILCGESTAGCGWSWTGLTALACYLHVPGICLSPSLPPGLCCLPSPLPPTLLPAQPGSPLSHPVPSHPIPKSCRHPAQSHPETPQRDRGQYSNTQGLPQCQQNLWKQRETGQAVRGGERLSSCFPPCPAWLGL